MLRQVASQYKDRIIEQVRVIDCQGEIPEKPEPAFLVQGIAVSQILEEPVFFFSIEKRRHGTVHLHTALSAAVADRPVRVKLYMLKCGSVTVPAVEDLPVADHGRSEVDADIQINEIREFRGCPELRAGCCARVMEETAGEVKVLLESAELQAGTVQNSPVRHF